ncbi:tail assembly protein [Achromobacter ruhlandii]|uniref:Phage tail protein n=1 Tax=Achromobacter ruhlandii TaxID=72557 RepID=A0ABM8LRS9_9BURK|nr:tail assembly protein [Achromobacter ruhlandii]AKP92247.1 Phage tail assembly protein I [Achromobacter xylosoxidans]MCZ8434118.1 tail assembly protein [Achromobacter ruhlandii]MDC6091677.1 tail assembly protein [Achromobacter ruhlandii]MDC6152885.1 tail assembly protein [Achromobacter ruhlandii]MDD7980615.1 tail assembly protein [Achromobacter ruhlandii]
MSQPLATVRLYGRLGAEFGRMHRLAVSSTAEAIRALCVLLPGFESRLLDSESKGVRYACFIGRRNLGEAELARPSGTEDIRIAPMPTGAKRGGLMQVVVGVAMIVASFIPVVNAALWASASTSLLTMGMAMTLGGVVQLLTPQQRALSVKDGPNNGASYNFNGPVNTTAQGNPVPVLYGEMFVGSATISAGIYSEDQV